MLLATIVYYAPQPTAATCGIYFFFFPGEQVSPGCRAQSSLEHPQSRLGTPWLPPLCVHHLCLPDSLSANENSEDEAASTLSINTLHNRHFLQMLTAPEKVLLFERFALAKQG